MSNVSPTSTAAFKQLAAAYPDAARQWLTRVIDHAGPTLRPAARQRLVELAANGDGFERRARASRSVAALFGAGVKGKVPSRLPVLHGTLHVERNGEPVPTAQNYRDWPNLSLRFTTTDGRVLQLDSDNEQQNDIFSFVPGTDVMAFDGMPVSVRGWLDPAGGVVRVTEFAPGHLEDFVFGRVVTQGDKVYVEPRGREQVEIKHPELKAQLAGRARLGVILPGAVSESLVPGRRLLAFEDNPAEFWMLVKFEHAPVPKPGQPGVSEGAIVAATSSMSPPITLPTAEVANIEVGDRMYVLGRFEAGAIKASKATRSAGSPWRTAKVQRGDVLRSLVAMTEV